MLRVEEIAQRAGLSRSTIIRKSKLGEFPAPVVGVPRQPWQWRRDEVDAWLAAQGDRRPVRVERGRPVTPPSDDEADREAWREGAGHERRFRAAVKKADRAHLEALYAQRVEERLRREALEREAA
jgi:predicted DNA-binding transcriptional regulator AlpA